MEEFVAKGDGNAKAAAQRAGFAQSTAGRASTWLKPTGPKPAVAHEVQERLLAQLNAWRLHDEYTQSQLYEMQAADVAAIFDKHNAIKPIAEWPRGVRLLVTSFEHCTVTNADTGKPVQLATSKVKLADRGKVIKMIGDMKGVFTKQVEHSFDEAAIEALQAGRQRAAGYAK